MHRWVLKYLQKFSTGLNSQIFQVSFDTNPAGSGGLVRTPLSKRCISHPTRDVTITHENPTTNAGASLPTSDLNSTQIWPDPLTSLAQVSACWCIKSSSVLLLAV